MEFDVHSLAERAVAFYFSVNILAALAGTVPGALVERKACATLERFHFLLFFFGGAAALLYLHSEIAQAMDPQNVWIANLGVSSAAGLYLGNVTARRLRNIAKKPIWALAIWVPVLNVGFLAAMAAIPTAPKKDRIAAGVERPDDVDDGADGAENAA